MWTEKTSYITKSGKIRSNFVAAFDFDGTLVHSENGETFMRTEIDWIPTVTDTQLIHTFRELLRRNASFVIFSNQLKQSILTMKRIDLFLQRLAYLLHEDIQPFVFISTKRDHFRKPAIGMWTEYLTYLGSTPSTESFYCGDAAGPTATNPLYRWSSDDILFANTANVRFYTPDEIFGVINPDYNLAQTDFVVFFQSDKSQTTDFYNSLIFHNPQCRFKESNIELITMDVVNGFTPVIYLRGLNRYNVTNLMAGLSGKSFKAYQFTQRLSLNINPPITEFHYYNSYEGLPFPLIRVN